ncbi:MAG: hypothetical protein LBP53_02785 [Candidatus Peribacteria bacterium]|jgi:oxygen-independent coproporphyrinogen-3 oxidase|nr:hypothetical protein [Candidatus Peribacteria bacterium]
MNHIEQVFDCSQLAELSIECNPFPADNVLSFVAKLNTVYAKYPRMRYSFGIQSFDNGVLAQAGRPYTFPGMVDFLRSLQPLKQEHNIFNLDFIAFGKFNQTKKGHSQLWTPSALQFFSSLANAQFADSFSLYTLELFEHQKWKIAEKAVLRQQGCLGTEEEVDAEFQLLKALLLDAGYVRYEISNFSLISRSSIHNRVYREMENYLGLGLYASSFLRGDSVYFSPWKEKMQPLFPSLETNETYTGVRFTNTPYLPKYLTGERISAETVQWLSPMDMLIETFFLAIRTDRGIEDSTPFIPVLVADYEQKLHAYAQEGYLTFKSISPTSKNGFRLTDKGMDCANALITELLAQV